MNQPTIIQLEHGRFVRKPNGAVEGQRAGGLAAIAGLVVSALVARFWLTWSTIGLALVVAAVGCVLVGRRWRPYLLGIASLLGFAGLAGPLALLALLAAPFTYIARRKKDRRARRVLEMLLAGRQPTHTALLLRPFEPSRGWTFKVASLSPDVDVEHPGGIMDQVFLDEHERFVFDAGALTSNHLEVVKVAERIELGGGGSIRLRDNEWQNVVKGLIGAVDSILMIPGDGEGLEWELQQVMALGRLEGLILLLPGGPTPPLPKFVQHWARLEEKYRDNGIRLPGYDADGLLAKLDSHGHPIAALRIVGSTYEELAAFVIEPANDAGAASR